MQGKAYLLQHLNFNKVLVMKIKALLLDTQTFLCIQARTASGSILRDREVFADFTEVTHTIQYQCGTIVNTNGGPWTSVSCKEVSSPKTGVFSILSFPKAGPMLLRRLVKKKCHSDDT